MRRSSINYLQKPGEKAQLFKGVMKGGILSEISLLQRCIKWAEVNRKLKVEK